MIAHFINFEWKQFFRSSYWQKSIVINILLVFVALYFILVFLALGFGLYPILKDQFPEADPLLKVNEYLFYWLLADLLLRFFFQKLPALNSKPLLILPLKRSKIIHYVLGKTMLSFFNFLPLFAIIPFGIILIYEDYSISTTLTWMFLLYILILITNFLNFLIESKSAETELSFLPIVLITTGLFAINYFNLFSISTLVAGAINAIITSPILLMVPLLLSALLYFSNYINLKKKLYVDGALKSIQKEITTSELNWTRKFGDIAPFLQLDLKLLWRNKRPRSSIFIVALGLLYGLFFYPNPTFSDITPVALFVGIFVTGIFMINFGQFIPAWDSAYYKLLMSQNIEYKGYLKSKFSLMFMSAILMFVLSIPYVYFGWKILVIHFAALIYNLGVNTYVLLFAGAFNRKKIDLTQRAAFNYQGTGAVQWLISIPLLLVPVGLFLIPYYTLGFEYGIAFLIIMGATGIVFHQKIMPAITKKYVQFKYKMISAFEQNV